ncbi:MAG: beta-galactosidase trimerization domain-containing protein, partial [Armatimonadota bacterium]
DYCVEVIEDLGFDGIWFDGCFMGPANTWPGGRIGCCCPRCERRFRDETGLDLPALEDWSDPVFRRFIQWRQHFFADYWRRLCQHVRAHSPTGLIGLNNFNRWPHPTGFGCPLNEVGFDGLSCAEVSQQPWQAPLMLKYLRQVSACYPPELWIRHTPPGPGSRGEQMAWFGEMCMTFGGFHSEGQPVSPGYNTQALRDTVKALAPRAEYVGGEPLRFAGIALSSNTKDFAFGGDDKPTWRSVHGMHNLLLDAHWPSEVILDNQIRAEHLRPLPLVILSDVRCLSDDQAAALEAYVRGGGTLLVTAMTGLLDEIGRPRERGVLDALMGVATRTCGAGLARAIAPEGGWARSLPPVVRLWPDDRSWGAGDEERLPERWTEDIQVMAWGVRPRDDPREEPLSERRAIVVRKVGEGTVLFIDRDVGGFYSQTAWSDYRRVVIGALKAVVQPRVRIEAAPHVAVTIWRQGHRHAMHVLGRPHHLRVVAPSAHVDLSGVPPAGPVTVELPWRIRRAERPVTGGPVQVRTRFRRSIVHVPHVDQHDLIVLHGLGG